MDPNKEFNVILSRIKTAANQYLKYSDKNLVIEWVLKLKESGVNEEQMKQRNDLMNHLLLCCEKGRLEIPFTQKPPEGHLFGARSVFATPPPHKLVRQPYPYEQFRRTQTIPMAVGGQFIVPHPLPTAGAFCHLAIMNNSMNFDRK